VINLLELKIVTFCYILCETGNSIIFSSLTQVVALFQGLLDGLLHVKLVGLFPAVLEM